MTSHPLWKLNEYLDGALEYRGRSETRTVYLSSPNGSIEIAIKIPGPDIEEPN